MPKQRQKGREYLKNHLKEEHYVVLTLKVVDLPKWEASMLELKILNAIHDCVEGV